MSLNDILGGFAGKAQEEAEELVKDRFGEGAAGMVGQFFGKKSDDTDKDDDSSSDDSKDDSDDSKDDDK